MMLIDPFFLHHIVTANAEIATALENLDSDDPNYAEKHDSLIHITNFLELVIVREVGRPIK